MTTQQKLQKIEARVAGMTVAHMRDVFAQIAADLHMSKGDLAKMLDGGMAKMTPAEYTVAAIYAWCSTTNSWSTALEPSFWSPDLCPICGQCPDEHRVHGAHGGMACPRPVVR